MELKENINEDNDLNKLNNKVYHQDNIIKRLNSELEEKNIILSRTKSYLFDLEHDLNNKDSEIKEKDVIIRDFNKEKEEITRDFNNKKEGMIKEFNKEKEEITRDFNNKREVMVREFNIEKEEIAKKYNLQISKLKSKDYCIDCLKSEVEDKNYEIIYLKKHGLIKKVFSPLSYIYLFFKSKPKELKINIKLFKALKDSECFDVGYYLNNNEDVINSAICKYFSPELHYIITGFENEYKFNKKYFDKKSKQDLLNYIYYCKKY